MTVTTLSRSIEALVWKLKTFYLSAPVRINESSQETYEDIIRQMITSRHKLIHRTADDLEMIQDIPDIHFSHWRKESSHSHRLLPSDHPIRIRRHTRNPNATTTSTADDRGSTRWSGHLEIEA
jgi:hypothetical protein